MDRIIPVDIYVPGDPPRTEQLIDGIIALRERILPGALDERFAWK